MAQGIFLMLCAPQDVECAEAARWYHLFMFIIPPIGLVFYPVYIAMAWERDQQVKRGVRSKR